MTDAVTIIPAEGAPRPLVFDSPHTGMLYPDDFRPALDMAVCERVNDWFVEDLFGAAPAHGAQPTSAQAPCRAYIDPEPRYHRSRPGDGRRRLAASWWCRT